MKTIFFTIIMLLLYSGFITAQSKNEWRPENRTGVSAETGLLKSWPAAGPALLWSNLDLARGFSSPSFGANTIYITGNKGSDDHAFCFGYEWKDSVANCNGTLLDRV